MIFADVIFDFDIKANLDMPHLREVSKAFDFLYREEPIFDFFDIDPAKFRFSERPYMNILMIHKAPIVKNIIVSRKQFIDELMSNEKKFDRFVTGNFILHILFGCGVQNNDNGFYILKSDIAKQNLSINEFAFHDNKLLCTRDFITSVYTGRVFKSLKYYDTDDEKFTDLSMFNVIYYNYQKPRIVPPNCIYDKIPFGAEHTK